MPSSDITVRVADQDAARDLTTRGVQHDLNFDIKDTRDSSGLPVEVRLFGPHADDDVTSILTGIEHRMVRYIHDEES